MFLKINQKTNRWIKKVTIIYLVVLIFMLLIKIDPITYFLLALLTEPIYVLLVVYMISVLIFVGEKTSVSVAFTIYIALDIISYFNTVSRGRLTGETFTLASGIMISIITIYLFILTLNVKNKHISFPYKLFGFSLFLSTVSIYFVTILFPKIANRETINYLHGISILAPLSILLTIKGVSGFIRNQDIHNLEPPVTSSPADA